MKLNIQEKVCIRCARIKTIDNFCKDKFSKDGFHLYCKYCKKILLGETNISINTKSQQKKVNWFNKFKSELYCETCGEPHIACLDFHHRNPKEKLFVIADYRQYGVEKILNEIAKCQILCANCHRKLHYDLKN